MIDVIVDASVEGAELEQTPPDAERLVAAAATIARTDPAGGAALAALVALYWWFVADEEMIGRTPEKLVAATLAHRELAAHRPPGESRVRVTSGPDDDYSVLEIVTDDIPFLVDSVTGALTARDLEIRLLVHPVVVVGRDGSGVLRGTRADVEPEEAGRGELTESWMRVEFNRIPDEDQLRVIRDEVARVLGNVRDAVQDWPQMRRTALSIAEELSGTRLPVPDEDITDAVELLHWLADDNFTFLGYREYRLVQGDQGHLVVEGVPDTGLGILRAQPTGSRLLSSLNPDAYVKVLDKQLLIITKANSRSTVRRPAYLDYLSVKQFDEVGNVIGERRFLGLFGSTAYRTSVQELPVVRRRVSEVIGRCGLSLRSHSGRELLEVLETYPRDDLFQISTDELYETVLGVLRPTGRGQVRLFARRDVYGRFISCLVYLPRDRFTTTNRLRIQEILLRELNGIGLDYNTHVTDSILARLHFIVRTDPAAAPAELAVDRLTRILNDATRLWDGDFRLVLERRLGWEEAKGLYRRYSQALPASYKDDHNPYEAAKDVVRLELMDQPGQVGMQVYRRRGDDQDVRVKVFRFAEPMVLSSVLPVPHSFGASVIDARPYQVKRADGTIYVYDFALQLPAAARPLVEVRAHLESGLAAAWQGTAEIDSCNTLVLTAGLSWREVVVLRAYAKYLHQTGTAYSQDYIEQTLLAYPSLAASLVELFKTRFDPHLPVSEVARAQQIGQLVVAIEGQLDAITSGDQDRILRGYLMLVQATMRTTFFQRNQEGKPMPYLAFKLDPQSVPDLPAPRPRYEIFVYSPLFEGVHLRFGPVARGGLRWSDRPEDFRTEVLGLVKAQLAKNAVIVPTGAKGGFVVKRPLEAVACYELFVTALLDLTDNHVAGHVVPPRDVICHDPEDPYLVVAADKGTATFSDIANDIAQGQGYWLDDAFASGGSAGYDHKKMAITARGAWESVRRHFRELGVDVQAQGFTAVGIGDMSGDVFGNGMLLSRHIRLVAAFDHRHVFLDPDPDPEKSFGERLRLYDLPRSSWDDYNRALISPGGGVWPRTAKSVPIEEPVRAALGLDESVTALTPVELIRAILKAPVDLLWNGGIGTYVKATWQSNHDVGDRANDPVRVNGVDLRCRVVGEGGNLGLTQPGRIEYATAGGRIYTDFIDNSGGVDCSDREVNIKILLGLVIRTGQLDRLERDTLLARMTDIVGQLVVRDNYLQAGALSISRSQARSMLPVHRRMISELERRGLLDRALEAIPDDESLAVRGVAGTGLSTPELAVLLAYSKIAMKRDAIDSTLCDDAWTAGVLADYFPKPLRERYAKLLTEHPLRREIVANTLVNEILNQAGMSFIFRSSEESGATTADVLRGYVVIREVFGLDSAWQALESLDDAVPTAVQTAAYLDVRRLLDRAVRWLLAKRPVPIDVTGEIARFQPGIRRLLPELGTLIRPKERQGLADHRSALVSQGIPDHIAGLITHIRYGFGLLDVVQVSHLTGCEITEVVGVYYVLSERLRVEDLLAKIAALPRENRWQTLVRMALRHDLYAVLAGLTTQVLTGTPAGADTEARVTAWAEANAVPLARVRRVIGEFYAGPADLAALSVLLRHIRTLVGTDG